MKKITILLLICSVFFIVGCSVPYFKSPMTISTRSAPTKNVKLIKPVRIERCDRVFFFIPIITDWKDAYEKLLEEAKQAGGDTVVDFQIRSSSSFLWMLPPFMSICREATGIAGKIQ